MLLNKSYKSKNYFPRTGSVEFLVIHYTQVPLQTTLGIFTNNPMLTAADIDTFKGTDVDPVKICITTEVSSHYVVSESGEIYEIVEEKFAAHHTGSSWWNGVSNLNDRSIGIEHVNIGFDWTAIPEHRGVKVDGSEKIWCKFSEPEIIKTIELCQEIIERHGLKPYNIVGHSDIACNRKCDPGPLFPWEQLAKAGIGMWYNISESTLNDLPENHILWTQTKLSDFGYYCPLTGENDEQTCYVVKAFQMHFRPNNIDGNIDLECLRILDSLCQRKLAYDLQN